MTDFNEPWTWKRDPNHKEALAYLESRDGIVLSTAQDFELSPNESDAERIVACVNAMKGIKDPGQFIKDVESLAKAASGSRLLLPTYQGELKTVIEHLDIELPT